MRILAPPKQPSVLRVLRVGEQADVALHQRREAEAEGGTGGEQVDTQGECRPAAAALRLGREDEEEEEVREREAGAESSISDDAIVLFVLPVLLRVAAAVRAVWILSSGRSRTE